jgi:hypothetical protein
MNNLLNVTIYTRQMLVENSTGEFHSSHFYLHFPHITLCIDPYIYIIALEGRSETEENSEAAMLWVNIWVEHQLA